MKTIGIIGGMGPMATADLFRKIVTLEAAHSDNEHIRVCIDSNTRIPDRTKAILYGGESPVREMVRSALGLEGMGADVLIMPCNTAHYFYEEVSAMVDIPILNMIAETADEIQRNGYKKVGLLATDGTVRSGVYEKELSKRSIAVIVPDAAAQQSVMDVIYNGVKSGNADKDVSAFSATLNALFDAGAQTLILGCTELPIALEMYGISCNSIDPTGILAKSAIRYAGGTVKD